MVAGIDCKGDGVKLVVKARFGLIAVICFLRVLVETRLLMFLLRE